MIKKRNSYFSLEKNYKGKCGTVGLVIKDVDIDTEKAAMLFITLKYNDRLIEAQIPLDDTPDFKRHIIEIISQASKLKVKKENGKSGK